MVQRASQENQSKSNGVTDASTPYLGSAPEHSMAFDIKDVADIAVPNVSPAEVSAKESNGKKHRTIHQLTGSARIDTYHRRKWIQNRQ